MSNVGKNLIKLPVPLKLISSNPFVLESQDKKFQFCLSKYTLSQLSSCARTGEDIENNVHTSTFWKLLISSSFGQETLFIPGIFLFNFPTIEKLEKNNEFFNWWLMIELPSSCQNKRSLKKLWGTVRQTISNSLKGLVKGYFYSLSLAGVGYKASVISNSLLLSLGFSHDYVLPIPSDISVTVPSTDSIIIKGYNKEHTSKFVHKILLLKASYKDKYNAAGLILNETP